MWRKAAPYVFISPFYILFLIFGAFPILFSGFISLTDWRGVHSPNVIGLANYRALFADPSFSRALRNVVIIGLGYQPLFLFLALLFATVLNTRSVQFRGFFRTVYFLPTVTSLVVVGLVFGMLFDPKFGMVNYLLSLVGIPAINWITTPGWMRVVVVIALIWRWTGYEMVIMLAGLQSISPVLYEAAKIDGAGVVQSFFRITVPLMRPAILFCVVMSTIGTFNIFDEPYMLYGPSGGNREAGLVPGIFLFRAAFEYFKFGYASSFAYVLGAIIVCLSMVQLWLGREQD
jgi:ABC-type sugar transport system permease subunit